MFVCGIRDQQRLERERLNDGLLLLFGGLRISFAE